MAKGNGDCFLTPERHTSLSAGGGQAGQGYPCVPDRWLFCRGRSLCRKHRLRRGACPHLERQCQRKLHAIHLMPERPRRQRDGVQPGHHRDTSSPGTRASAPWSTRTTALIPATPAPIKWRPLCPPGTVQAETMSRWSNRSRYSASPETPSTESLKTAGNGIGYQADLAYTLTATDHHAVFSRQRVDIFKDGEVTSTQSARQHKDATDLVLQGTDQPRLIRRLTPLECERLQGFPDNWTAIPNASDSARYKALGNSVAIPCVDYVLRGISLVLLAN